jgi:hypothetical protein
VNVECWHADNNLQSRFSFGQRCWDQRKVEQQLNRVSVSSPMVQLGIPDKMSPEMEFLDIDLTKDSSLLLHAIDSFLLADF